MNPLNSHVMVVSLSPGTVFVILGAALCYRLNAQDA